MQFGKEVGIPTADDLLRRRSHRACPPLSPGHDGHGRVIAEVGLAGVPAGGIIWRGTLYRNEKLRAGVRYRFPWA
jgi:hypothetical protein